MVYVIHWIIYNGIAVNFKIPFRNARPFAKSTPIYVQILPSFLIHLMLPLRPGLRVIYFEYVYIICYVIWYIIIIIITTTTTTTNYSSSTTTTTTATATQLPPQPPQPLPVPLNNCLLILAVL